LAAPADAAPFQLLKTFDSELVGSATFEFTIETRVLGVWVEIPCVDGQGSCSLTFSNVAAGSSFMLADSDAPWFSGGEFYVKEVAPPRWEFGVGTSGASSVKSTPSTKRSTSRSPRHAGLRQPDQQPAGTRTGHRRHARYRSRGRARNSSPAAPLTISRPVSGGTASLASLLARGVVLISARSRWGSGGKVKFKSKSTQIPSRQDGADGRRA
jgi:hypothetical protein